MQGKQRKEVLWKSSIQEHNFENLVCDPHLFYCCKFELLFQTSHEIRASENEFEPRWEIKLPPPPPPPSEGGQAINFYTESERLTHSRRVFWAWSKRITLYNRQIMTATEKDWNICNIVGPDPSSKPPDPGNLCRFPPHPWRNYTKFCSSVRQFLSYPVNSSFVSLFHVKNQFISFIVLVTSWLVSADREVSHFGALLWSYLLRKWVTEYSFLLWVSCQSSKNFQSRVFYFPNIDTYCLRK